LESRLRRTCLIFRSSPTSPSRSSTVIRRGYGSPRRRLKSGLV
jgi:hypothetical protein